MIAKFISIFFLAAMTISCGNSDLHSFQGYIEGENIYLASSNAGILKQLFVQRGQKVKRNQILFQLDENPQRLIVVQVQADLSQAQKLLTDLQQPRRTPEIAAIQAQINQTQAQLELAQLRVARREELYRRNAGSKESLDEALTSLKQQQKLKEQYEANLALAKLGGREHQIRAQEAQVTELRAKLNEAKWQLNQKTLYAPEDGLVFDTFFQEGEMVGSQQAVLALLSPDDVRAQFFVPAGTLPHLRIGQKITIKCYGCTENEEAVISYISPEAEFVPPLVYSRENSDKLVFRVKARLKHPEKFKPGEPITVALP